MDELDPAAANADQWTMHANGTRYRNYVRTYQFYNWEHQELRIALLMLRGRGKVMYHRTGERESAQNIYTAVPVSGENSLEWREVLQGETGTMTLTASDCYGCWYFVRVEVPSLSKSSYRLTVARTATTPATW